MLDEGVRVAVPEARTVGYVEREAYAEAVLLARMGEEALEPAPVWCGPLEDLKFGEWRGAVDCLTAGFPCQPWSAAGQQRGEADDRWLWPAIRDGIRESGVPIVFLENVPGLVSGCGLNRVLGDLAALGFDAEWCSISAADVGAAHLRERIFILAVGSSGGRGVLRESSQGRLIALGRLADGSDSAVADASERFVPLTRRGPEGGNGSGPAGADPVADAGCAERRRDGSVDGAQEPDESEGGGGKTLADAGLHERRTGECGAEAGAGPDGIGRERSLGHGTDLADASPVLGVALERSERDGVLSALADERSERLEGQRGDGPTQGPARRSDGADIFAPGPTDPRWPAILDERPFLAPAIESGFCRVAYGDAVVLDESRIDQLRAIGNGVVALQAGVAFAVLARRILEGG